MKLKNGTPRQFWIWLLIFIAYLVIQIVGYYLVPQWMGYQGKLPIFALNSLPPYNVSQAFTFLDEYGSSGRAAYTVAMAFDVLFPFLYATLLSVGLRLTISSTRFPDKVRWAIGAFPFLAAFSNWIADIFILILLNNSGRSVAVALIASVLTTLKFLVLGICIAAFLIGAIFLLARKVIKGTKSVAA